MAPQKKRVSSSYGKVGKNKRKRINTPREIDIIASDANADTIAIVDNQPDPSTMKDMLTCIREGLKETSHLPLGDKTMSNPIGSFVKAYWDLDNVWYDGRILLYDPIKASHYIYFPFDGTSEWMDLSPNSDDIVLVVAELVIHKNYPAMRFTGTNKALQYAKHGLTGTTML